MLNKITASIIFAAFILFTQSCGKDNVKQQIEYDAYYYYEQQPEQQRQQYLDSCANYFDAETYQQAETDYYYRYAYFNQALFLQQYCSTYKKQRKRAFICTI